MMEGKGGKLPPELMLVSTAHDLLPMEKEWLYQLLPVAASSWQLCVTRASDQVTGEPRALIQGPSSNITSHCFSGCSSCKIHDRETERDRKRKARRERGK